MSENTSTVREKYWHDKTPEILSGDKTLLTLLQQERTSYERASTELKRVLEDDWETLQAIKHMVADIAMNLGGNTHDQNSEALNNVIAELKERIKLRHTNKYTAFEDITNV